MPGPERPVPSATGKHNVQVRVPSVCPLKERCHLSGRGIVKFGTAFPQPRVMRMASSSVVLMLKDGSRMASGTLIALEASDVDDGSLLLGVVLAAGHTIESMNTSPTDFVVALNYAYDAKTAPGLSWEQVKDVGKWTAGTLINDEPDGRVLERLEGGTMNDIDYAMLLIAWNDDVAPGDTLEVDPAPVLPRAGKVSKEVLLVGHPWTKFKDGEATQCIAGTLLKEIGPQYHPGISGYDVYAYAELDGMTDGFSGGGVFNDQGELVGIGLGWSADQKGHAFLNLQATASANYKKTDFLQRYVAGQQVLTPSEHLRTGLALGRISPSKVVHSTGKGAADAGTP